MKKIVITALLLIGSIWGYNTYAQSKASGTLKYQAGSFKFDKITTTSINAHGTLDVYNPTNTPISINGVVGEVFLNNSLLANFNNQKNITIQPNGTTSVGYDVSSFSTTVLNALIAAIAMGQNQTVTISGYIRYGVLQIPFKAPYKLADIIKNYNLDDLVALLGANVNNRTR